MAQTHEASKKAAPRRAAPEAADNALGEASEELTALRAIVEGTAAHTGEAYFESLVRHLATAVGTRYAFVAEFAGGTRARTLAFWFRDRITENVEWDVMGTRARTWFGATCAITLPG